MAITTLDGVIAGAQPPRPIIKTGITVDSSSFVNTPAKQVEVWVSGGTLNTTGTVTITVTTADARVFARVLSIPIETL